MFTGIIETMAQILRNRNATLTVERPAFFDDVHAGSSIAVSGACLTITRLDASSMTFDVVPETLARTTLNSLETGDRVNLERAMRADGRFDGHVVQGHVEGVGEVIRLSTNNPSTLLLRPPRDLLPFILEKGSIAIDGVSLTIAKLFEEEMSLALIPSTLRGTTLGDLREGDTVNVETDLIVRTLLRNSLLPSASPAPHAH